MIYSEVSPPHTIWVSIHGKDKVSIVCQGGQFQTQFAQPSQFVPQQTQFVPQQTQFVQQQSPSQGGGFGLGDVASTLLSALGRRRRKRQTTMHGQAIR